MKLIQQLLALALLAGSLTTVANRASADVIIDEHGNAYATRGHVYVHHDYYYDHYVPEHVYYYREGSAYTNYYRAPVIVERTCPTESYYAPAATEYPAATQYQGYPR